MSHTFVTIDEMLSVFPSMFCSQLIRVNAWESHMIRPQLILQYQQNTHLHLMAGRLISSTTESTSFAPQTYVGTGLVSVNPYRRLALYTPEVIHAYRSSCVFQLPPHM